jgi:hypothetical protein
MKFRLVYDAWRFERPSVEALLTGLCAMVEQLPSLADLPAAEIAARCAGAVLGPATTVRAEPRRRSTDEFVGPRTPTEREVASAWQDTLGVDGIGVTEDFFALPGADSLAAVRLVTEVERRVGRPVPLPPRSPTSSARRSSIPRSRRRRGPPAVRAACS